MAPDEQKKMTLPTLVFGKVEVRRLQRELEGLDDFLRAMAVRRQTKFEMPRVSRMLDALANENHLDLLKGAHRTSIAAFLKDVLNAAPTIHMSFAADPSSAFTAKIVSWLRANIHQFALLDVGLQPNIAAGCVVRTTNKVFDLSLRRHFAEKHDMLLQAMQGNVTEPVVAQPQSKPEVAA